MNINPTRDIILIEVDKAREKTASGIFIVEDWRTLPPTGIVKAIGPDVVDRDLLGKHVMFERYTSVTVSKNERFCREINILGEVDGEG